MLLFVLYLHQILSSIRWENCLKCSIKINQSNKTLLYSVEYSGSSDFKMDCQEISLEPGSLFSYQIEFLSRFSKNVKGKLWCLD